MISKTTIFFLIISIMVGCTSIAQNNQVETLLGYTHPIPFAPKEYVCYRAATPLVIDGKLEESVWRKAPQTEDFIDIEGSLKPAPTHQTYAKMLWDDTYFYFGAMIKEPHVWAKITERDAVIFLDDDFEIFIDPDGDSHNYYEFEMNALNTVWDLILLTPYREKRGPHALNSWDIQGLQSAVHVEGTLNDPSDTDSYWSIEVAIPWKVLKEMTNNGKPPVDGDQWRVNFSRVDWTMDIKKEGYKKRIDPSTDKAYPENNWVWSPTGFVNMHMPEQWGFVQFSDEAAGKADVKFNPNPEEKIKWELRQLHYQQLAYFNTNGKYAETLEVLSVPQDFNITLHSFPSGYEAISEKKTQDGKWRIREDGKVWKQ